VSDVTGEAHDNLGRDLREANFRLCRKLAQMEALHQASLALGSSLEEGVILGEFLPLAISMLDARGGLLLLRQGRRRGLHLVEHANLDRAEVARLTDRPFTSRWLRQMRQQRSACLGPGQLAGDLPARYLLAVPMGDDGIVVVVDRESRTGIEPFTDDDCQLLELACRTTGGALAKARLHRNMMEERNLNQSIVTSVADGLISTDLRGAVIQHNEVIARLFGSQTRLVGRSCAGLLARRGCSRLAAAVRASLADGQPRQIEAEPASDGLMLEGHVTPRRDAKGQTQGVVVALADLAPQTRLRALFEQYASDKVVALLLAADEPPSLGGELRPAVMLFVDLVGSTALLGRIGAEEMVRLTNACFTRLVDVILHFDGTLDKYTGDGFLAVYGVPVAFPDDVVRAARSALAIRDEMVRFNQAHGVSWGLKMGMSCGLVVAGNIGSPRRMEYTVIGPDVSLAARLSDRARGGQILVSPAVQVALSDCFVFAAEGEQEFRGIADPLAVYQLLGPRGPLAVPGPAVAAPPGPDRVCLSLPALPDMELAAIQVADCVGGRLGLATDRIEEIKLALIEACINAIEHGQSRDGRVQLLFAMEPDALRITVADCGRGFDVDRVRAGLARRQPADRHRRGWGLRLIGEMMDQFEVHSGPGGTSLTMVKHR
jgi:PAS domain S-box-containing protein